MKKLSLSILLLAGLTFTFASCGGSNNKSAEEKAEVVEDVVIKPSSTSVSGKLGGFLEVEDKEYHLTKDDFKYSFTVSFKHNGGTPKVVLSDVVSSGDAEKSSKPLAGKFIVELLDANGNVIETRDLEGDDFNKLVGLSKDEKANVKISCYSDDAIKAKSFEITSAVEANEKSKEDAAKATDKEPSTEDLEDGIETASKAIEAAGAAFGAIGGAAKALNELNESL